MNSYHHPYHGPGPDHHPLFDHDLDALLAAHREHAGDFYVQRSIERRIEQAVPGMTAPLFAASADTQARARRAVHLFRMLAVSGSTCGSAVLHELRAFLDITQPDLGFAHHPSTAA